MEILSEKTGPLGGIKGDAFDDGVFDGVKKVTVGKDKHCLGYIKIEYEKDGKFETRVHGTMETILGELKEFSVKPNEYITAVGGSYNHIFNYDSVFITSLYFTTSTGRTSPKFGETNGDEFLLEGKNGGKLLGFHGRSGQLLDAIGPHFDTGVVKLGQQGGTGGNAWDHGVYIGVRKVVVTYNPPGISHIIVDYDKAGKVEMRQEGNLKGENQVPGKQYEFVLDYPNEYITSIEGSCDLVPGRTNRVRSVSFKTSTERTSPTYGGVCEKTFVLESKGKALVGFHGRAGLAIDAIGAYFGPVPIVPPAEDKLQG